MSSLRDEDTETLINATKYLQHQWLEFARNPHEFGSDKERRQHYVDSLLNNLIEHGEELKRRGIAVPRESNSVAVARQHVADKYTTKSNKDKFNSWWQGKY